jgi:hypothetical protein
MALDFRQLRNQSRAEESFPRRVRNALVRGGCLLGNALAHPQPHFAATGRYFFPASASPFKQMAI